MPDQGYVLDLHHLIEILLGGIIAVLSFFGKRYINKVEELEDEKADKSSVNKITDAIHNDIRDVGESLDAHRKETNERLDRIFTQMVANAQALSNHK